MHILKTALMFTIEYDTDAARLAPAPSTVVTLPVRILLACARFLEPDFLRSRDDDA